VHRIASATIACLAFLAFAATAEAKTYYLDSFDRGKDPYAGPLRTQKLVRKAPYLLEIKGTFSFFDRSQFRDPFCGTPESQPIFPTKGKRNGPVVGDAEFLFADTAPNCSRRASPITATSLQMRTSSKYTNPVPIGGVGMIPLPDHAYRYGVVGAGRKVRFRLPDAFTRDNYGRLRIRFTKAQALDCANGAFANWAYVDEATCVAATLRRR